MGYIDDTAKTLGLDSGNSYRIVNALAFYIRMTDAADKIKARTGNKSKTDVEKNKKAKNAVYESLAKELGLRKETVISLDCVSYNTIKSRAREIFGVTEKELDTGIGDVGQLLIFAANKSGQIYDKNSGKVNFNLTKNYYDNVIRRVMPLDYWRMVYQIGQRMSLDAIIAQYSGKTANDIQTQLENAKKALNKSGADFDQMIAGSLGMNKSKVKEKVSNQEKAIHLEIFKDVSKRMINATGGTTWSSIAGAVHRSKEFVIGYHPFYRDRVNSLVNERLTKGSYPDKITLTADAPLLQSASYTAKTLVTLKKGATYNYSGESQNGYYKITANGQTGWCSRLYATYINGLKTELDRLAEGDVKRTVSGTGWFKDNITDAALRSKPIIPNTTAGLALSRDAAKTLLSFCKYKLIRDKIDKAVKQGKSDQQIAEMLGLVQSTSSVTRKQQAGKFVGVMRQYSY